MENFWSTLKTELVFGNTWTSQTEAENALFTYIDGFYNPTRIQKRLGWLSPDEYEAAYWQRNRPAQPDHDGGVAGVSGAGPLPAPDLLPRGAVEAHGSRAATGRREAIEDP